MRVAIVDLGSNSTRLLVADVDAGGLKERRRETKVTRLGQGVEATGRLAPEAVARVMDALEGWREDIAGTERTLGVLTSAVRDADDGADFADRVRSGFGLDARVLSGDEEATMTFLGATDERTGSEPVAVIDIGGGSTEIVVGSPGAEPSFHVSTQAGAVRHTERHVTADPPARAELDALAADARATFAAAVPAAVRADVSGAVAVAGTATSLAAIAQDLEPYDPSRVHGFRLGAAAARDIRDRLAALTTAERRDVRGLHPDRAPTIVAGCVLMVEAMAVLGVDSIEVSEHDILRGAARRVAAA